ncbi:MAG: ClpXP protease specificity-enhancing factor SspB, partial [Rhodobacteraceae bacterium]|nr:ClpXP protease specificity-enhancing factor SspB [Paracoccaceae bacterium]
VRTFVDPSVEFGLRFETHESDEDDEEEDDDAPMDSDVEPEPPARKDAEVVSLDKWRK